MTSTGATASSVIGGVDGCPRRLGDARRERRVRRAHALFFEKRAERRERRLSLGGRRRGPAGTRLERLADLHLERADLRVLRRDRDQALEVPSRAHHVAELAPRDRARLNEQERRGAVLSGLRDGFLGELDHALPVPALLSVGLAEELERSPRCRGRA